MSSYCYYSPEAHDLLKDTPLFDVINSFADQRQKQIYILRQPLSKNDATYDYENSVVLFTSGMKPCFINLGGDEEEFEEFTDEFTDDLSYLSEKFKYKDKIGRRKKWQALFVSSDISSFDFSLIETENNSEKILSDLITSLVIGSINDISTINIDADNLLDKVKSKIILFDTDQTEFVFRTGGDKKYIIQGLAGSGKTELLLHKMKEIYSKRDSKIAFTCYNRILASSMKSRIPDFFDFMRVEKQIDWNNKLFCFHAWGSGRDPYSGMYRYICHAYGITFGTFQAGSFDYLCQKAIKEINQLTTEFNHLFDYVFIDESQDFPESFIELCCFVTSKKVYVAGDVFQNIFSPIDGMVFKSDLVLRKCYRTDPRNLMFSHALGMGLFEKPVLRWLTQQEWDACGYSYSESNDRVQLSRASLRRFEDIPTEHASTVLHTIPSYTDTTQKILQTIEDIIKRNNTATMDDFAVILLDRDKYIYDVINELSKGIHDKFNWKVNISHESKMRIPGTFFISNVNNAKGLEFPFVICVTFNLNKTRTFRNALYTMMARSFLESHLLLGVNRDSEVFKSIENGLAFINKNNFMDVRLPEPVEIENQRQMILVDEKPTLKQQITDFCVERGATPRHIAKMVAKVTKSIGDDDYDEEYLERLLDLEFSRTKQF